MLVRKVREERAKEQTEGRKMCDCEPFFCVSKCGVEQTRAEKQWSFSSMGGLFVESGALFPFTCLLFSSKGHASETKGV